MGLGVSFIKPAPQAINAGLSDIFPRPFHIHDTPPGVCNLEPPPVLRSQLYFLNATLCHIRCPFGLQMYAIRLTLGKIHMKRQRSVSVLLVALIVASGCTPQPPAPPVPHSATSVNASFAKTWDAVIDVFAARNIGIQTIDRASGLIVAVRSAVPFEPGKDHPWADCGKKMGRPQPPTHADYNIRVKGDASRSTVQANASWLEYNPLLGTTPRPNCNTKGVWETEVEANIKTIAEGK